MKKNNKKPRVTPDLSQTDKARVDALAPYIRNNRISCKSAHDAAGALQVSPGQIGPLLDALGCKVEHCQLGLFGYGTPGKKLDPDICLSDALELSLTDAQKDNCISCLTCWNLAEKLSVTRLEIGSACEKKQLRIRPCQLGIF
jgi:hypothetical protein